MTSTNGKNVEKEEGQAATVAESAIVVSEGSMNEAPKERSLNGRTTGPTRRSTKGQWTSEEDAILCKAVQRFKGRNWKKIAECFPDRTDVQCLHRWQKVLNPDLVKGPWSKEEDDIIVEMVNKHGPKKWSAIAQALPGRIGKQCRERWHNHLNPSINKEAWTQEEEIILIHAHQIYGNKWAELTKVLPGRTDNAIKNHWNSSVKKKLDSYMASGLLAQFKGLPQMDNSMQYISSSAVTQQNGEEDRRGVDSSDCSQSSSMLAGYSQADSETTNKVSIQKDLKMKKKSRKKMVQDHHLSTASNGFYTSLDEVSCDVMAELQIVDASSADLLTEVDVTERVAERMGAHEMSGSSSLEDCWKSKQTSECHTLCSTDHGNGVFWPQTSLCNVPNFMQSSYPIYENQDKIFVPGVDYIHGEFPETEMCQDALQGLVGQTEKWESTYDSETYKTVFSCSSTIYPVTSSGVPGISSCENLMSFIPSSYLCPSDAKPCKDEINAGNVSVQIGDSEVITCSYDGFAYSSIPYSLDKNSSPHISLPIDKEQDTETPKESSMGTEVASSPSISYKVTLPTGNSPAQTDKIHEPDGLFYQPPHFPSLEIPFVSCDLVSSGEFQQPYSPLGIRQLMSSVNCSSPFNLWDSPSHEKSPDALLNSAAKSFLCTPSIMKKRHRGLLSPLQERRNDKKSGIDINHNQIDFSSESGTESCCTIIENKVISIGFSSSFSEKSLVTRDKQKNSYEVSVENKENSCHKSKFVEDENDPGRCNVLSESSSNTQTHAKSKSCMDTLNRKIKDDATVEEKMPSAVLAERDVNDLLLYSPGGSGGPANRLMDTGAVLLKNGCVEDRNAASSGGKVDSCTKCISSVLSPKFGDGKKDKSLLIASKISAKSTYPSQCVTEKESSVHLDLGSLNILADTPSIKRGIESPSAWKSPWFMNSLLPIQRIGTDLTYEGVGYFVSPASGSYDAIGLMRQLSEHTAAAVADAQEISGSRNSAAIPDRDSDVVESLVQLDKDSANSQIHSKVMVKARVLDFSGCITSPNKRTECGKL